MPPLLVLGLVGLGAVAVGTGLVALDRMALKVVRPPRRPHRGDPGSLPADVEEVVVPGAVPLHGWWIRPVAPPRGTNPAGAPLVVLVHGWGANASVLLDLASPLLETGVEVFAFDVRSHGRSAEGPWVTLGQFVEDTQRVVDYVRQADPTRRIVLAGHSMGGAAAIVTAADDPTLAGVILIAAPHDMYGTLTRYLTEHGMPGNLMVHALRPFWSPRLGRSSRELDPGLRAAEVRVPVLVIQPERDARVPVENGVDLASDTGGTLLLVPGAGHNDVLNRAEVSAAVGEFVASV